MRVQVDQKTGLLLALLLWVQDIPWSVYSHRNSIFLGAYHPIILPAEWSSGRFCALDQVSREGDSVVGGGKDIG